MNTIAVLFLISTSSGLFGGTHTMGEILRFRDLAACEAARVKMTIPANEKRLVCIDGVVVKP